MKFKKAQKEDAEILFDWRNDALTRENSIQTDPVKWDDHVLWLEKSLANPDRHLFIAVEERRPIGTVRFDREGSGFIISWTMSPAERGKGFGKKMVAESLAIDFLRGSKVIAMIKMSNIPSVKIAEAAHFTFDAETESGMGRWIKSL